MSNTHIVIVNYNAGDWLRRSVESALMHSEALVTVVDNCSSDDSIPNAKAEVLASESSDTVKEENRARLSWISNAVNVGFAAANNQVLGELTRRSGTDVEIDYVVLMNPDCELAAGTLDRLIRAFETYPQMGLVSCRILNEDGSLQASCRRRFPTPWTALVRTLQLNRLFPNNSKFTNFDYGDLNASSSASDIEWVDAISGAFIVARLSAVKEVGLLDEAYFMHCEDLDWCKRFAELGWQVGFVSSVSVTHAKGVSTRSRPIGVLWTLHKGMNRFYDKFYKQTYSLPIRYFVKLGIFMSFLVRAGLSLIKRLFAGGDL